jgi:peroxiredoxin
MKMKKKFVIAGAMLFATSLVAAPVASFAFGGTRAAAVGERAPSWTLSDTKGVSHNLAEYQGKYVVLEWTNPHCPYVQKHYKSGNMQSVQKYATSHGVVWLSVDSSAKGREGYETPAQGQMISRQMHSMATAELLDPEGTVGHEYGAKTTPDIMIIDPKGILIYSGAIDDTPTTDIADLKTAHNYVRAALKEALAGEPVKTSTSQPYGCSIKYGSSD